MDTDLKCGRCGNRTPVEQGGEGSADWNVQWRDGRPVRLICPDCQTPAESAQAEANAAELRVTAAEGGQFVADPVICMTGTLAAPDTILYGETHLHRVLRTGQAEHLTAVEHLPPGTHCLPTVGGVLIHPPISRR